MENISFKKSYLHDSLKEIKFIDLWNSEGAFTTIRIYGRPAKYVLVKNHIKKLNSSLKYFSIKFNLDYKIIKTLIGQNIKKNLFYDHLLRIAINKKIISFSLRKCPKVNNNFTGIFVNYKRKNYYHKHLKYIKILNLLKKINRSNKEIILCHKNIVYEGCTTNIICIKNNNFYLSLRGQYNGVTISFFKKKLKNKIQKKIITKSFLRECEEIILVGSGKGVVSLKNIPQISWRSNSDNVYKRLKNIYETNLK